MNEPGPETQRTRASLVAGLQAGDEARWQEFFPRYGPMIRRFALKAGCTETEADEVVQETAIGVARNLPEYRYDPAVCRFKTWLLKQSTWRVKDQFRKRARQAKWISRGGEAGRADSRSGDEPCPDRIEQVADPAGEVLERLWEAEWQESLVETALRTAKERFSDRQFQIFDLNVRKGWPAGEVAKALHISLPAVYLARHRVAATIKREVARLEQTLG